MNIYQQRDETIALMGFASYAEYLASDLWQRLRRRTLKKFKNKCVLCCGVASQVHHRSYDRQTLSGEDRRWLVALCDKCHESIELDGVGKRPFAEVDTVLDCTLRAQVKELFRRGN